MTFYILFVCFHGGCGGGGGCLLIEVKLYAVVIHYVSHGIRLSNTSSLPMEPRTTYGDEVYMHILLALVLSEVSSDGHQKERLHSSCRETEPVSTHKA